MLLGIITSPWSEIVTTLVISTAGLPAHLYGKGWKIMKLVGSALTF